jgi:hypothetical protein
VKNWTYINYEVEVRPRDTLSEGRGWGVNGTLSATARSTTFPRDSLSEGRGGEVLYWNGHNIDYEVKDCPRNTLLEGRGWVVIGTLSATTRSTTSHAIPCLRAVGGEGRIGLVQILHQLRGRLPPARHPV